MCKLKTGLPRMQNKPKPPKIKKENHCNDCFYFERGICWNAKIFK
jgi:CRISPR/Cas system-associated exonuclease Cas4 (RecB family)